MNGQLGQDDVRELLDVAASGPVDGDFESLYRGAVRRRVRNRSFAAVGVAGVAALAVFVSSTVLDTGHTRRPTGVTTAVTGPVFAHPVPAATYGGHVTSLGLYSAKSGALVRTLLSVPAGQSYSWVSAPTQGRDLYLRDSHGIEAVPRAGGQQSLVTALPAEARGLWVLPSDVAVTAGGSRAAYLGSSGVQVWSAASGQWQSLGVQANSLAGFLPDGHTLVLLRIDHGLLVETVDTSAGSAHPHTLATLPAPTPNTSVNPGISAGAVAPDGTIAVAAGGSFVGGGKAPIVYLLVAGHVTSTIALAVPAKGGSAAGFVADGVLFAGSTVLIEGTHQDCLSVEPVYAIHHRTVRPLVQGPAIC